jgi:hypothetical protein
MLLVVFGAGASYDSDPDHPPAYNPNMRADQLPPPEDHRPPLANRLFDNRLQFLSAMEMFPECRPLIPRLRRSGIAVEKELARLQVEANIYPERHQQLAAIRYYLRHALWQCQDRWRGVHRGITNYATLLDELERWRVEKKEKVCFVTFNYDLMLEEAMEQVLHLQVKDMDSYISWDNYSLFKPHGSVDWGRVVKGMNNTARTAPSAFYQHIIKTVRPNNSTFAEEFQRCDIELNPNPNTGAVLFPAISIPVENKDEFSCPLEHQKTLKGLLPKVTKMITIGWRATEEDFLKLLLTSRLVEAIAGNHKSPELLVVTGSKEGAEQTVRNLAPYEVIQDPFQDVDRVRVTTGFTGLINNLETLAGFLRTGLY